MTLESGHEVALKPLITLRPKHGMPMLLTQKQGLTTQSLSVEPHLWYSIHYILMQTISY